MKIPLTHSILRPWTLDDIRSLAQHANNRRIWRNMRDTFPFPYTNEYARSYIERAVADPLLRKFAIEVDGEAVGSISLHLQKDVHFRSAEAGCWLGEDYWNRNIGAEALRTITDYGFEHLGLVRIYGLIFEWNTASIRMTEKAGWQYEGRLRMAATKDGETIDELLYSTIRT